jgi:hypothetical protein
MTTQAEDPPAWITALYSLHHPIVITVMEALLWIGEPLSATAIAKMSSGEWSSGTISHHFVRLAERGVVEKRYERPRLGVSEHYYGLVLEAPSSAPDGRSRPRRGSHGISRPEDGAAATHHPTGVTLL